MMARVRDVMAASTVVGVEAECGPRERDADRRRAHDRNHRLVEEPRRRDEDDFVAGVDGRAQRDGDRRERPGREVDVGWLEIEAGPRTKGVRDCLDGRRNLRRVREPFLVFRDGMPLDGLDDARQWHLVRVAEHEIADRRIADALRVFGVVQKVEQRAQARLNGGETGGDGGHVRGPVTDAC